MIERLLAGEDALARNDLDVADRLFGQVADADPRNAIAVVGRARVALRRGDPDGARGLAQRALEIDPDEAAAARLLAQLPIAPTMAVPSPPTAAPARPSSPAPSPSQAPAPTAARRGWRAWLARLLRRG